ncbi:Scramblase [Enhygromyxa salina]|uniref:Scramblase n=1 Tax=Enhygromyxa salina TaxID=215803 RepID=A0A2S9XE55_9BACT|nr:phospholipid scramblase-related protein [Enhygromyxa salina]PRP91146.1 Scramblase [Enhygromyxa salina]
MSLPAVVRTESLIIRQHKELTEVFTNMETANRYSIELPSGEAVMHAAELGEGAMALLTRSFLKARRPFRMTVHDTTDASTLELHRPWRWLFSRLDVVAGDGQALGSIQQRFSVLTKQFSVLDPSGAELATLHGPVFRPWTFRVLVRGQEVGKITKEWSSLLEEAFTDADTFGVQFSSAMSPQLRALVLAATFLIDFLYFENRD